VKRTYDDSLEYVHQSHSVSPRPEPTRREHRSEKIRGGTETTREPATITKKGRTILVAAVEVGWKEPPCPQAAPTECEEAILQSPLLSLEIGKRTIM